VSTDQQHGSPGWGCPAAGCLTAIVATAAAVAWIGFAAYASESAGVQAALLAAFPLGAVCSWALVALVVQLAGKESGAMRWGAPAGCACLGGAALLLVALLFFTTIFPAL